jgi:hypothetical protein
VEPAAPGRSQGRSIAVENEPAYGFTCECNSRNFCDWHIGNVAFLHSGRTDEFPGGGRLASLSVAPLKLTPSFSPDIHDYVVRCAANTNTVQLS